MLEEIKKRIQIDLQLGHGAIILDTSDVNWLIEQVEKVNSLENRIVEINSKWQLLYDETKKEISKYEQANKEACVKIGEGVEIMNEKDKKIIEALQIIADTFMWLNAGGKDITDDVNNLYEKINELKGRCNNV